MLTGTNQPITAELVVRVADFLAEYAGLLDDDQFEEWLELFEPQAPYRVLPLENLKLGLPAALLRCSSRDMLEDRILALRKANEINIHTDRHIVGWPRIRPTDQPDVLHVKTSFCCFQTTQEGVTSLYAVGYYDDRLRLSDDRLRIVEKTVVLETFSIPSLIAVPL